MRARSRAVALSISLVIAAGAAGAPSATAQTSPVADEVTTELIEDDAAVVDSQGGDDASPQLPSEQPDA